MKCVYLIVTGLLFVIVSGCYYDNVEELYPAAINQCDTVVPTYSGKIQTLVNTSCAISGCHVSNAQSPDLSNYTNLKNNIGRVRTRAVVEKSMPPTGPLSTCDALALQQWIDNGALNN